MRANNQRNRFWRQIRRNNPPRRLLRAFLVDWPQGYAARLRERSWRGGHFRASGQRWAMMMEERYNEDDTTRKQ